MTTSEPSSPCVDRYHSHAIHKRKAEREDMTMRCDAVDLFEVT